VNYVRTRCGGANNQPKACLPALAPTSLVTQAQIIAEIYNQRKYELFATGLRWEDVRRQGLVSATSAFAKRCWLLYPNSERNTEPNVPPNPPTDPPVNFSRCGV
jgi:SusD family.